MTTKTETPKKVNPVDPLNTDGDDTPQPVADAGRDGLCAGGVDGPAGQDCGGANGEGVTATEGEGGGVAPSTARAEWLGWRRHGIGGSDIGALLGLSSWSSPWSLWADKCGLLPVDDETTQRQRIGLRMESVLAAEFHDETDLWIVDQQVRSIHPDHPELRATLDGLVAEGPDGDPIATVQFKTDARYAWAEVPAYIRAQCIWEMHVAGVDHAFLAVMFAGFRFEVVARYSRADPEVQDDWELMRSRALAFWHDHVLPGNPPPIDGSDATTAAISAVWPSNVDGTVVDLDDMAGDLAERAELKAKAKAIKDRLAEIDNNIRAAFGDADTGCVDGTPVLTYRAHERAGYTVPASTVRVLRAAPKPKPIKSRSAA